MKYSNEPIFDSCDRIVSIRDIADNIYSVILEGPSIARSARPGQFVMVRVKSEQLYPLLRRAFSIARVLNDSQYELLIQGVGTGTKLLRQHGDGDCLEVLGPLGSSFDVEKARDRHVRIVVGGIGVAPAFILFDQIKDIAREITIYYGSRSANIMVPMNELEQYTRYATEDGSRGYKGFVTDILRNDLEKDREQTENSIIFACGPNAMLKTLEKLVEEFGIEAQVSIETLMACGIGVCMGCPVEKKDNPGEYYYACKDGPVFSFEQIRLNQTI
jgi:dihydroorotate dehydrogenase electron transfer subunit